MQPHHNTHEKRKQPHTDKKRSMNDIQMFHSIPQITTIHKPSQCDVICSTEIYFPSTSLPLQIHAHAYD